MSEQLAPYIDQAEHLTPDRNPTLVYLSRLGTGSRAPLRRCLDRIASMVVGSDQVPAHHFPWWRLRYQHTQAVRAALLESGYKPSTINQHLAAMRGVLQECWRLGFIDADIHSRATDLQAVRAETLPAGREIPKGEILALFEAAAKHAGAAQAARDAAMLALLYAGGLRRSEVVALQLEAYNGETGEVKVIQGKGRKDRIAWLTKGGRDAMGAWLEQRGDWPGPLICPITKGGVIQQRAMSPTAVYKRARFLANRARIANWSPHDMRRTFVSHLLDAGADLSAVKELAGHASIQTTARYDRRGEDAKRGAADLLFVPFKPPGDTDADATQESDEETDT